MEEDSLKFLSQFFDLTEAEKAMLSELNIVKHFKKGAVLLREGDVSKDSFYVKQGCIRSYTIVDGDERTIEFYTETEFISPPGNLNNEPSSFYIDCIEDCIINVSTSDVAQEFFTRFPRFESVCRVMTEELLVKNQVSFANFKIQTPEQRYIRLMETRPDLLQRVPQHQIASYLGVKPESLSRIRKRILTNNKK
jgi:CRP-like cAMP-binding protein